MKKVLLLLAIIAIAQGSVQWLTGVDTTQSFFAKVSDQTTLTKDKNKVPRSLTAQVKYQENFEYEQIPKVFISVEYVHHMSNSNLIEYKVTLDEVTKTGFTYTITVNFNSKFKSLYVRWASVNDTHVEVQKYDIPTPNMDGSEPSQKQIKSIKFDKAYKKPPQVAIYVLGGKFVNSFFDITATVEKITTEGANIVLKNKVSVVKEVNVEIVIVPENRGKVVRIGDNYFGNKRVIEDDLVQIRYLSFDFPIESKYQVGSTIFAFKGFSGYTQSNKFENTLKLYDENVETGQYQIKLGVWSDTLIAFGYADILFFEPRDDCAYLYEECDFQGGFTEICRDESLNSFASTPFEAKDIKSIYVPNGMSLQLYNEENVSGLKATFADSNKCIEKIQADE